MKDKCDFLLKTVCAKAGLGLGFYYSHNYQALPIG